MFDDACAMHWDAQCIVGGGGAAVAPKIFGMGCLITPEIGITASHVYRSIEANFSFPVVGRFDGWFRSEILFDSPQHDVMILRTIEKIKDRPGQPRPTRFPGLLRTPMRLGSVVGYLARLRMPNSQGGETGHTYFAHGSASSLLPADGNTIRVLITGGVVQKGFSGGPVFLPDGELVGVIVEALRFPIDPAAPLLTVHNFPIATPLAPVQREIQQVLADAG